MKYLICNLLLTFLIVSSVSCIEPPKTTEQSTFEVVPVEACLGIMIDMSGSFHNNWEDRAHKLFMQLLKDLFSASAGNECRVVLGQLSASEPVVLFEGRPQELRQRFRSPEDLNSFLKDNSDPAASNVYQSTRQMLDYVGSLNGVEDTTQLVVVCLSDMVDSEADEDQSEQQKAELVQSMRDFNDKNGALALYYVDPQQASFWRDILTEAGFQTGDFVIETSLSESPRLPEFH